MGSWLSKVMPDLGFFKNATINSNCCNKTGAEYSYTNCIHCRGSGRLYIKSFEEQNIDAKRNAEEILALTD